VCSLYNPSQAEELGKLQEERTHLLAAAEEAEQVQQQLERLRQRVRDMSPLRQQLAEASQQLSELQGVEERLLDYRAEITRLQDSRRELQQALQMQAAITAEVSMLQREYDALTGRAQHAQRLQEEIPRMQVGRVAGV
jgi:DNA repair exonuclease SbcCD ATPase subunit